MIAVIVIIIFMFVGKKNFDDAIQYDSIVRKRVYHVVCHIIIIIQYCDDWSSDHKYRTTAYVVLVVYARAKKAAADYVLVRRCRFFLSWTIIITIVLYLLSNCTAKVVYAHVFKIEFIASVEWNVNEIILLNVCVYLLCLFFYLFFP